MLHRNDPARNDSFTQSRNLSRPSVERNLWLGFQPFHQVGQEFDVTILGDVEG